MPNNYAVNSDWVRDNITVSSHNGYDLTNHNIEPISSSNNYSTINYVTINDTATITGARTFTTSSSWNNKCDVEWVSAEYYDYVSDMNALLTGVKNVNGDLYIGEEYLGYKKLANIVKGMLNVAERYKNLKKYEEPPTSGEEYNE